MKLTPRQREILQATAHGQRIKTIAEQTRSTAGAIRAESYRLKRKLGAKSIGHAIAIGMRQGIID